MFRVTTMMNTISIVYEDNDLLAINKPAGIVVNRSQTTSELTIQDWVEERCGEWGSNGDMGETHETEFGDPVEIFKQRSGIVHRLDKETSGILLIAKHPAALQWYMQQFKDRLTEKTYIGLVHGKVQPSEGTIDLPIARNSQMRLQYAVREDGKASQTIYKVLNFFPNVDVQKIEQYVHFQQQEHADFSSHHIQGLSKNFRRAAKIYQGFSLIEMKPKTGRTHQLRVHFSHLRHPIVGDKTYSGSKRRSIDHVWCERHFLHALRLKITQYRTNSELNIEAPLSEDLQKVLEFLVV